MIKNLEEAEKLVKLYRSLSIDDFDGYEKLRERLSELTGFGAQYSCSLCKAVNSECRYCLYSDDPYFAEVNCVCDKTYKDITTACTANMMVKAIRARADYIENLINKIKNADSGE